MSEKIVLREITYEQMSTLVTELNTNNFVKEKENKELKNRIDKVVHDMEDTLQKYTYYDDYSVDASMINFWIEMLLGSDKE